jgi:ABC-type Fe3+ transport system permease subunit
MFRYLPVLPHVMLVLPFLVRILRPAFSRIEPAYYEQVQLLKLTKFWSWWHSKGAFMVAPLTMAASLCLAFSLGEFGATYLLIRVGSWDSLSIMTDQLLGRPKFDPLIMPTAMAVASTLMLTTLFILWLSEQLRARRGVTND